MKHTDFFELEKRINQMEYDELYKAVEAHGGRYSWEENEDDDPPIIAVNVDSCCPNPDDIIVTEVFIEDGHLEIRGVDKTHENEVEFSTSDVFAGHLSAIIGYIPDTEEVNDVTIYGDSEYTLHETIADLAQFTTEIMSSGTFDSRAVTSEIIRWAKEFCKIHPVSVWEELDYFETLDRYAAEKIKEFINNHI